jgi:hypothetical protein
VLAGATPVYTIIASPGYIINQVFVDGVPVGAVGSYTFPPVYANRLIGANFTVDPNPVTVIAPNGGENWARGSNVSITWTYTSMTTWVRIELLKGGIPVKVIAPFIPRGTAGSGFYNWTIPLTQLPGDNYRVRVVSTSNPALSDTSNANFTIN